jgi:hypothetical protein
MTEHQHRRLERYEITAAEFEIMAVLTTDETKQAVCQHLAEHFRDLAADFREALGIQEAA